MKLLSIAFGVFILAVILLADLGRLPGGIRVVYDFPYGDKVGHFILYGVLALLIDLTFFRALPRHSVLVIAFVTGLTLALLIGLEELSQRFLVSRTYDFLDLTASYAGVAMFSWVAVRLYKKLLNDSSQAR